MAKAAVNRSEIEKEVKAIMAQLKVTLREDVFKAIVDLIVQKLEAKASVN